MDKHYFMYRARALEYSDAALGATAKAKSIDLHSARTDRLTAALGEIDAAVALLLSTGPPCPLQRVRRPRAGSKDVEVRLAERA